MEILAIVTPNIPSILVNTIVVAPAALYACVYLGGYRDSLGHRLLGIKVVRSNGADVGLGLSVLRGLLILSLTVTGVLVILFSRRRRALYDMLSDTLVIKNEHLQQREVQDGMP